MTLEENIKAIQVTVFDIFREFEKICRNNGLQYFLVEGSMLGAIRHHGIIPWDDDIDVAMPREDYEKFFHICFKQLPKYLYTQYYEFYGDDDTTFPRNPRICDRRHMIECLIYEEPEKINPWIDIFVLDGMPRGILGRKLHYTWLQTLRIFYKFVTADRIGTHLKRSRVERIGIKLAKKIRLGKVFSAKRAFRYLDNAMKKYKYEKSNTVIMFGSDYREKQIMPKIYYGNGRETTFEDTKVIIPEQAEKILAKIYGNYMEFPPIEQRRPKHKTTFLY